MRYFAKEDAVADTHTPDNGGDSDDRGDLDARGELDTRGELGDLLLRVARRLRHATFTALAPMGLSPHQSRALRIIAAEQPVRPSVLAARLRIAPRSATDVLDGLAERGWIERSPDPDDRRATLVSLTESGRELSGQVAATRHEESERLFGNLGADERHRLADLLAILDRPGDG